MDKTKILDAYDILIDACTNLHDIAALSNLYYGDINKCMKDAIVDESMRMYETLNMNTLAERLNNSFTATKRNTKIVEVRQENLDKELKECMMNAKNAIKYAESICLNENYDGMYTPSLVSLGRVVECSAQTATKAKRLEYVVEQCIKELDKMNMFRDSMRKTFMLDLSRGTSSNIQNTELSEYKGLASVLEDMKNNNKNIEMLKELKEFAIQQNKDFSKLFDEASVYKQKVRETSYSRIREEKIHEMMVKDVSMEYDGPVLE